MFGRLFLHHARRRLHSSGTASSVPLSTPTFAIFGANTGVGKTLVSAGLAAALLCSPSPSVSSVSYLKPLQTGYPVDSDARFVFSRAPALLRASASPRATRLVASCRTLFPSPAVETKAAEPLHESQEKVVVTYGAGAAEQTKVLACCTAYAWREPVSPHLAAEREGMAVGDDQVKECVAQWLLEENVGEGGAVWKVLETAGGVASPGASGTLQCDLYRCACLSLLQLGY
jgi:dethiobiotin synthetase/adenosylmethionine--8-amino-7-oxononanoate aminotransferase